jgi:hypothetical protein
MDIAQDLLDERNKCGADSDVGMETITVTAIVTRYFAN